jgi:hypothetical protein
LEEFPCWSTILTANDDTVFGAGVGTPCPMATDASRHIAIIGFIELSQYNKFKRSVMKQWLDRIPALIDSGFTAEVPHTPKTFLGEV